MAFSKKLDSHIAAVALYAAHYKLCRVWRRWISPSNWCAFSGVMLAIRSSSNPLSAYLPRLLPAPPKFKMVSFTNKTRPYFLIPLCECPKVDIQPLSICA